MASAPQFPLTIAMADGDREVVQTPEELALALEWFDSTKSDGTICITDATGARVTVVVEAFNILRLELDRSDS